MGRRDHHPPCPCGEELADECPKCARTNPLGSMRIERPVTREELLDALRQVSP